MEGGGEGSRQKNACKPMYTCALLLHLGHCITTALPGEVCDLDSYAVDCDVMGLTATTCRCYQDTNSNNNTTCEGREQEFLAFFRGWSGWRGVAGIEGVGTCC